MVSSKFCRRPRIQPLPKVCKPSPETQSCYDRPVEPPEPLHCSGCLQITTLPGARLYYSTFRGQRNRGADYEWDWNTTDSHGNPCNPRLTWDRPTNLAEFNVTFSIPIWGGQSFDWPNVPLSDAFPWLLNLKQTIALSELHSCNVTFWN